MTDMTGKSGVVLITAHCESLWLERLRSLSPTLRIEQWSTRSAIPDELWQEVEILYTSFATTLPSAVSSTETTASFKRMVTRLSRR